MAKQFTRAVVALLVTFFVVGCSTIHKWTAPDEAPAPQKPAAETPVKQPVGSSQVAAHQSNSVASLPGSNVQGALSGTSQTREVIGEFPSSNVRPAGRPWVTMHANGFTGDHLVAGKLMGLSDAQAKKYADMHSRGGACVMMNVPNGIVLDRLTFTRDGKHHVQHSVKVELKNPSSTEVTVCDLGDGVIAMRFHGCSNHALVRGWTKPLKTVVRADASPTTPAPQAQVPEVCPNPQFRVRVWEKKAIDVPGVRAVADSEKGFTDGWYTPGNVSRKFTTVFIGLEKGGSLKLGTGTHPITINLMKADGSARTLPVGTASAVTGMLTQPLPADFTKGDAIQVIFADHSKLATPFRDLRARWEEFTSCISTFSAIEK